MLRTAAINIVDALGVEGGCNCQFALHPTSFEYAVIEVNPRVSRSSALASKATGYPIAKVATKIAIGYTLDEIINAVTGKTYAAFEPSIDYVAVKFPKWPFDKFVYAKRNLGTQMKATGEVMSIADTFEMALMKAVRGAEISLDTLNMPKFANFADADLWQILKDATDERLFAIYELLRRGVSTKEIHDFTMIDMWFLDKIANLLAFEREIAGKPLTQAQYTRGKKLGLHRRGADAALRHEAGVPPRGDVQDGRHLRGRIRGDDAVLLRHLRHAGTGRRERGARVHRQERQGDGRRSRPPARSASARASSSTTPACTASSRCSASAMKSSSSTTTRKRFPRTSTRRIACTLSRCAAKT